MKSYFSKEVHDERDKHSSTYPIFVNRVEENLPLLKS